VPTILVGCKNKYDAVLRCSVVSWHQQRHWPRDAVMEWRVRARRETVQRSAIKMARQVTSLWKGKASKSQTLNMCIVQSLSGVPVLVCVWK